MICPGCGSVGGEIAVAFNTRAYEHWSVEEWTDEGGALLRRLVYHSAGDTGGCDEEQVAIECERCGHDLTQQLAPDWQQRGMALVVTEERHVLGR